MNMRTPSRIGTAALLVLSILFCFGHATYGRERRAGVSGDKLGLPFRYDVWRHDVGDIWASVVSGGHLGDFEFPSESDVGYLQSVSPVFGCVKGPDTLVTNEFNDRRNNSETYSFTPFTVLSTRQNSPWYSPQARAEQEYSVVFSDTSVYGFMREDELELRSHRPIGIEGHLTTFVWSEPHSKQALLCDWWFKNISTVPIQKACVGIRVNPGVYYYPNVSYTPDFPVGTADDLCGFVPTIPAIVPGFQDTINLAWIADNDGDPSVRTGLFTRASATGVAGIRFLRVPSDDGSGRVPARFAFNWWAREPVAPGFVRQTWGPSRRDDRVIYQGSQGMPVGDRGNYHMMANGEIDYGQVYAATNMEADGWKPPPTDGAFAHAVTQGKDIYIIMSYGPLPDIAPGDSVPLTVAFVAGAGFHRSPTNIDNLESQDPQEFLNNLDFKDLTTNARWADWIFDNPGADTDGDGNRGRAYEVHCNEHRCDSVFYKGDGIPDWKGPSAPPPPPIEVTTVPGRVIVRWTGEFSETVVDPFSRRRDFEGYRLYLGKFDQNDQYSFVTSWDLEDYRRRAYNPGTRRWEVISYPASAMEWRDIMGDPGFDLRWYDAPSFSDTYRDSVVDTLRNAEGGVIDLRRRERLSYWEPEDFNRGNTYWETNWTETNKIQRIAERDTTIEGEPMRYGIYEAAIDNLNPAVPLFVSVTAFDYGDYQRNMDPLESSRSINSAYAEFIYSSDVVIDSGLQVVVFPNPYKSEYPDVGGSTTTYFREGYEGRGVVEFEEQDRRIHFINLPDTAVISIYSLDGDLIRRIHHPDPFLTTYSSSVGWDLVSRNTQAVVSGLYIWKVDSRLGSQTGKLVIIK